jgi:putative hemolysin
MPTWAMWAICLGLLFMRALLGASESALYGTSDHRAKELSRAFPRRGGRLLRHKTEREATAAALRFGMVLFGFLAAAIATLVPPRLLDLSHLGAWAQWTLLTPLLSALFVAILASIFDVTARAAASGSPEQWALRLSSVVSLVVTLLYPLMRVLVGVLNLILKPFKTRVRFEAPPPPLEELEKLLAAQAAKESVDKGAPALIRSIFELSDKTCRDVMVPRTEVVAVDITTSSKDILRILSEENHSRMPVYKDDADHIVGVLHVRDLLPMITHPELIVLSDSIRPAHFVPWVKPIGDLLRDMQRQKIHMAMVVDEFGGFMGIVTLEDILREIVGDIGDEFEVEVKLVEKQADGSYLVDAAMYLSDFAKAFSFQLPEGDYETVAGFLSHLAGSIPDVGDKFTANGWQFIVHSKEGPRLDRIRLVKPPKGNKPAAEQGLARGDDTVPGVRTAAFEK